MIRAALNPPFLSCLLCLRTGLLMASSCLCQRAAPSFPDGHCLPRRHPPLQRCSCMAAHPSPSREKYLPMLMLSFNARWCSAVASSMPCTPQSHKIKMPPWTQVGDEASPRPEQEPSQISGVSSRRRMGIPAHPQALQSCSPVCADVRE